MKANAYEEWLICKRRGHQPGNIRTASIPPQNICKWCGTYYWYAQPVLHEHTIPQPPEKPVD